MWAYTLRRLLALIPTLIFASLIVFATVRMIPGDVIDMMLSQNDISAGRCFFALRQDATGDNLMRSLSIVMLAAPSFWAGAMVLALPAIWWGWAPSLIYVPFTQAPWEIWRIC
ncbi:hypothetical protein ACERNI_14915 [Camelimonas sp. ID_303_24]